METMRFTVSVRMAVRFVITLVTVGMTWKNPELTAPVWTNFEFFDEIKPLPVRRTERLDPKKDEEAGSWMLARVVEFYYRKVIVARVHLIGQQFDRNSHYPCDNRTCWGINRVQFLTQLGFNPVVRGECKDISFENVGLELHPTP